MSVEEDDGVKQWEDLRLVPFAAGTWALSAIALSTKMTHLQRHVILTFLLMLALSMTAWWWTENVYQCTADKKKRNTWSKNIDISAPTSDRTLRCQKGSIRLTFAVCAAFMCVVLMRTGHAFDRFHDDPLHDAVAHPHVMTCSFRVDSDVRTNSFGTTRAQGHMYECQGLLGGAKNRSAASTGGKVMLVGQAVATFQRGEKVTVRGILKPDHFLRPPYIGRFRVRAVVDRDPQSFWVERAHASRAYLKNALTQIDPKVQALISGIALGDKNAFTRSDLESFQRASFSHLIAVSGLHTGIILGAAGICIPGRGTTKAILTSLLLGLIVIAVGPGASIVRSCIMAFAALVGILAGRGGRSGAPLCIAIIAMLLWDPWVGLSPGFALSAAATAGVIWPARWILTYVKKDQYSHTGNRLVLRKIRQKILEICVVSFWAQICIIPIAALAQLPVSPWGLITNLLIAPVLVPLCVGSVLTLIFAQISMNAAVLMAYALAPCAHWVYTVASIGAALPYSALKFTWWQGNLILIATVFLAALIHKHKHNARNSKGRIVSN